MRNADRGDEVMKAGGNVGMGSLVVCRGWYDENEMRCRVACGLLS